ncbi:MAG: GAF domain-containing sensor histidine kinase, partial [Ignavibacteriae bacterium]|nr:GAF domain-containing sensor histidine kinase [Ignavibacteriota bacterium]
RDLAFCSHAIESNDVLVVNDTLEDERFYDNPLVVGDPNIRFYAGSQLKTKEGYVLGTLCAIDRKPRTLSENQLRALKILSKQVIARLELRKSYDALQKHAEYLNDLNYNKDKFFRIISHDLRSPFSSILGFAELLQNELPKLSQDEIKEISINIGSSASSIYELVKDLLEWSNGQEKEILPEKTVIDLEDLFNKIISVLAGLIVKKKLKVSISLDANSIIYADRNMIFSVFQNIITNAIKFTPEKGTISIISRVHLNFVKIIVEDSGIGMNKETINNLMDNGMIRSRNGTNGEIGNGIGFITIKDFIQKNNGTLSIISKVDRGCLIKVEFPRT